MRISRIALTAATLAAVGTMSACSNLGGDDPEAQTTVTVAPTETETGVLASPDAPAPSGAPSVAAVDELRYVNANGPACTSIWSAGADLPADYDWCSDEKGDPIAGPRIGSCEVVTYQNQFFAIPGREIQAVSGVITNDNDYLDALTSCKRKPFPPGR